MLADTILSPPQIHFITGTANIHLFQIFMYLFRDILKIRPNSYDYGAVHVLHFTSEMYVTAGAFDKQHIAWQYNFIKDDLEKAKQNRDKVPWIITTAHR